jgi:hypothetical protein
VSRKYSQLRKVVDTSDLFISDGNQDVGARQYARLVPAWAKSDKAIKSLLLRSFPKLATDPKQREAAGRWAAVINLYFRLGYTRSQVAEEIGSSSGKVHGVIRNISRVINGLRANGSGLRGGKRGRRKKSVP